MSTVYPVESFQIKARHIDQTFHIDVALPTSYASGSDRTFPIAYVLDGNMAFHTAANIASLCARDIMEPGLPEAIVVGIGYPNPADLSLLRVRDLTPPDSVDDWFADVYRASAGRRAESGGAHEFLEFIQTELHADIARRYRVEPTAAIFGDSYGGLFTYYALLARAELFDRYWIGSPGVFGSGTYLLEQLQGRLSAGFERPTRVCLTLGALERSGTVHGILREEIYQQIASAYDHLLAAFNRSPTPNLAVTHHEFPDETHISVFPVALMRAWRELMRGG